MGRASSKKRRTASQRESVSPSYDKIVAAAAAAGFDVDWHADHTRDRTQCTELTGKTKMWPPTNPFTRAQTPLVGHIKNLVFGVVLVPVRLVLTVATLVLLWLWLELAILGADTSRPMAAWRRSIMRTPIKVASRVLMFISGFYWVKETYIELQEELPPASIVISNHSGYMEILYSSMRYGCCYVSKAAMASKPIFGTLMKCQQCIFVDRESGKSHAGEQIIERARHPDDWPMLAMYPEGTTTNGGQMISFRSGAFIAGAPIRPLIVKYRYVPSAEEKKNPRLYAANVRRLMSVVGHLPLYDLEWADKLQYEPRKKREKSIRLFKQARAQQEQKQKQKQQQQAASKAASGSGSERLRQRRNG